MIHSADDPFLPADRVPQKVVDLNPHLHAAFTSAGGHIGFVAGGTPWRPVFWAEREAARFLTANLRPETADS